MWGSLLAIGFLSASSAAQVPPPPPPLPGVEVQARPLEPPASAAPGNQEVQARSVEQVSPPSGQGAAAGPVFVAPREIGAPPAQPAAQPLAPVQVLVVPESASAPREQVIVVPQQPGDPAEEGHQPGEGGASAGAQAEVVPPPAAPVTDAKADAGDAEVDEVADEPEKDETEFVKGDLTRLGGEDLSRRSRFVVAAGYNAIGKAHHLLLHPQVGLNVSKLQIGLGVPLNVEIFNAAYPRNPMVDGTGKIVDNHIIGFGNAGTVRAKDWDEPNEWARILRYFTYGKKEDRFYVDLGQQHVSTLGHGTIMRRYDPNIHVDRTHVGAQLDAYNDYVGVELMTNDVVLWEVMGGLAFVKPLAILGAKSTLPKSLSFGVTVAADRAAPWTLLMRPEPACPVPGKCTANVPDVTELDRLAVQTRPVAVYGFDVEAKLVKTRSVDIKPYLDYSRLAATSPDGQSGGSGLTVGVLGRFNFGTKVVNAIRLVGEFRLVQEGYRPGYFDTFYEVDRYLMHGDGGSPAGSRTRPLTKLESTVGPARAPAGQGYYVEASWGIKEAVGLTLALEGVSGSGQKNLLAHFELPVLSFFQVYGTLYKRGFEDLGTIAALDERTVAVAGARLKVLPILFVSARAFKSLELDAFAAQGGPLGSLRYQSVEGVAADVALGWEF